MEEEEEEEKDGKAQIGSANNGGGESETDDDTSDEEDYGPSPAAGVWAGSAKLENQSHDIAQGEDDEENDDRPNKKSRLE